MSYMNDPLDPATPLPLLRAALNATLVDHHLQTIIWALLLVDYSLYVLQAANP